VDIGIGVLGQQIFVGLQGVVQVDLGDVAVAAEGTLRVVGFGDGDDEIVDADETAFYFCSIRFRDGDRDGFASAATASAASASAASREVSVLEELGIGEFGADALQVFWK